MEHCSYKGEQHSMLIDAWLTWVTYKQVMALGYLITYNEMVLCICCVYRIKKDCQQGTTYIPFEQSSSHHGWVYGSRVDLMRAIGGNDVNMYSNL